MWKLKTIIPFVRRGQSLYIFLLVAKIFLKNLKNASFVPKKLFISNQFTAVTGFLVCPKIIKN